MTECHDHNVEVMLARHDERLKNIVQDMTDSEQRAREDLKLARDEIARRLAELNGEQGRIARIANENVSREKFDGFEKDLDRRMRAVETAATELTSKLWLPMIVVTVVAAAIGAAIVRFVFK